MGVPRSEASAHRSQTMSLCGEFATDLTPPGTVAVRFVRFVLGVRAVG